MKKLIQGIVSFRKKLTPQKKKFFTKLAAEQNPDALFITCSDSRIVPNLFASTNPGDLFVLRNIGNIVPPFSKDCEETSVQAALEFSLLSLKITDIIVCGHSECGAMQALLEKNQNFPKCLCSWLQFGKPSLGKKELKFSSELSALNHLSQKNVLQQIEHLESYSFVQEKLQQNTLRIHGWWFDIAHAEVYCYERKQKKFILINEQEAEEILKRLG